MTLPLIPLAVPSSSPSLSAAEAAFYVQAQQARTLADVSFRRAVPIDSVNAVVASNGARWLAQLRTTTIKGIQLDPAGNVGVAATEEAYAKAQIATRLATPGLSFGDRAFTYATAVQAFASQYHPERLPDAEAYLKALDAMGDPAAMWQFQARSVLVEAYYQLGRADDVIRLGTRAIALVPVMEFIDRSVMYDFGKELYVATAEALAGRPNGRARIDSVNAILRRAATPAPTLAALDPWIGIRGSMNTERLTSYVATSDRLGRKGARVLRNYWLNWPGHDSAAMAMDDGRVHVLVIGNNSCAPCLAAMYGANRLQQRFPTTAFVITTSISGSWGNRLIEPKEEVAHLTDSFLNYMKLTIPIGIWAPQKVVNEDGGVTPEDNDPIWKDYPFAAGGKPMIWIMDRTGTIRRVFPGGYSAEIEAQIARTVQFLEREGTPDAGRSPLALDAPVSSQPSAVVAAAASLLH